MDGIFFHPDTLDPIPDTLHGACTKD